MVHKKKRRVFFSSRKTAFSLRNADIFPSSFLTYLQFEIQPVWNGAGEGGRGEPVGAGAQVQKYREKGGGFLTHFYAPRTCVLQNDVGIFFLLFSAIFRFHGEYDKEEGA